MGEVLAGSPTPSAIQIRYGASRASLFVPYKRVHKEDRAMRVIACDRRRIPHC